jgi:hypothetical protein
MLYIAFCLMISLTTDKSIEGVTDHRYIRTNFRLAELTGTSREKGPWVVTNGLRLVRLDITRRQQRNEFDGPN